MGVRIVAGAIAGIAVSAVFLSWLDARIATRIDQRVELAMEAAVRAVVEAQREEIARTRAATIATLDRAARERGPSPR